MYPEMTLSSPYREYIGFPADDNTKKCFRLDLHRIILSSTINPPRKQKDSKPSSSSSSSPSNSESRLSPSLSPSQTSISSSPCSIRPQRESLPNISLNMASKSSPPETV